MRNTTYDHCPRFPEGETVELSSVLPGEGPVMLEVGPGRGMFALQWCAANPGSRLLALEIRRKWATILDERLRAKGYANARCFAEDAGDVLPRIAPDGGVRWAAVHFPDPWWKKRHAKRLVVRDSFVDQLARLVAPGGMVFVQTDVEERGEQYRERFAGCPLFEEVSLEDPGESPFAPARSNREARAIADGLPIYRLRFRRR